jgi:hypothetical protein
VVQKTISGLNQAQSYTYTVTALDSKGRESAKTATCSGTTNWDPINDSFNRADNGDVLGTATSGQTWVPVHGAVGISSSQAYHRTTGSNDIAAMNLPGPNVTLQAKVAVMPDANSAMGLIRLNDDKNFYLCDFLQDGRPSLWRVFADKPIALDGQRPNGDIRVKAGDTFSFTIFNNTLSCKVNGQTVVTFTDSSNPFGTPQLLGGMRFNLWNSGATDPTIPRFDDFAASEAKAP